MKKRLRKKLERGEYRNPVTFTKREREGNAQVFACVSAIIREIGEEKFIRWAETQRSPPAP